MRTTIDIDPVILSAVKERQRAEGKSLGTMVSELLAAALAQGTPLDRKKVSWPSAPMGMLVDIDDKEALWAVLDGD